MDLLAPCRSCLQCLPFFHDSPPSSPRLVAVPSSLPESEEAPSIAASSDPAHTIECPDVAPAIQEQDLPLLDKEEEPQIAICEKSDGLAEDDMRTHSSAAENETATISEIIIAPAVSASEGAYLPENTEPNKNMVLSELPLRVPFINDISFSTSGLLPLTSPITPAAIGTGYPAGQYYSHPQIYPNQHHAHAHAHAHEHSHHGQDSSHYGHDYAPHGLDSSHQGHDNSHHGHDHDHSHHGHTEEQGHIDLSPLDAVPLPHPPLDLSESVHEHCKDPSHHDPHHDNNDGPSMDDAPPLLECENPISENVYHDDHLPPHEQTYDSPPFPPLETSQSMPVLDVEVNLKVVNGSMDVASTTNGASAGLLQTFHSEPIAQLGNLDDDAHDESLGHSVSHLGHRQRRRDHFKDHLKGIGHQVKQGGHHLKEEGGKHLQTIISNVNKQAQQIEQSGSFFNVPR